MMEVPSAKELERQVLADRKAEEQRQIAEEVNQRQAAIESERLQRELKEEQARERLLRPMERQSIHGTSLGTIKKRMMGKPCEIAYVELGDEIVDAMEGIFGRMDFAGFSAATTTLLRCLVNGEREGRKAAREHGENYLKGRKGGVEGIPILAEAIGGNTLEVAAQLICGWVSGYLERKEAQEALLKEG